MGYETILYESRGHTARITLNRPSVLNAVNKQMTRELGDAYARAEADPEIWTLIVTGAGRALCSGADVSDVTSAGSGRKWQSGERYLEAHRDWDAPQEATPPFREMAKPLICAVNGLCAGAGLDLVTTGDIVIASERASFFDPHVSIGIASGREMVRLARVLPLNVAMRVALLGRQERLDVQRAYQLGLVTEVVPHERLEERAWELADLVNRNAPLAVRGTRMAIRKGLSLPLYEAELLAESYRLKTAASDDALEGPRAFMEKRDPVWKAQ
jgi:enoyl-CoA hydratase/carnithine racemase